MDRSCLKHYHVHDFDPKVLHETYFSASSDYRLNDETVMFPIKQLMKISGKIKGDTLIDFSAGCNLFQLLPICEGFKEIIILESADACIKDLEKWMKKERNAIDWSHASQTVAALEGKSDKWKEKEESLRQRVKNILKCDCESDNPTHPVVLKKADCLLSLYALHFVSKDLDAFCSNLRKVSSMLKLGGRLLLFGGFNANYYTVDGEVFHLLPLDEPFLRKALLETGFVVLDLETIESTVRNEVTYYEHIYFIDALKVREK